MVRSLLSVSETSEYTDVNNIVIGDGRCMSGFHKAKGHMQTGLP